MLKKLLILILLLQIQIFASQNIKEIFVVSENWDTFTNEDGSGLYFDIVRMVYKDSGIKVKIKIYPYKRSSMMVEKKRADVWLASYLDEEDYAIYPKYYFDEDIVTAMFKKSKFPNFSGVNSLKNKNVCWVRGYSYDEYIDVEIKKHERNDRKSILLSLDNDRFDIFLDDEIDMKAEIKKINFNTSKYRLVKLLRLKLYPGFRNDEKGRILLDIWDKEMKKLIEDGSLKKTFQKI